MNKPLVIKLNAGNYTNGNPRRCFLCYNPESGALIRVFDEGYSGNSEVKEHFGDYIDAGEITTTPREYRSFVALDKDL